MRTLRAGGLPWLLSTLVAVVGCSVHPAPIDTDIGVPVPEAWAGQVYEPETSTGGPWWKSFGDSKLDQLIAEALERNRDLQAAAARIAAAEAEARIAGSDLSPQIGSDLSSGRRRVNYIGLPVPGGGNVLTSTSTSLGAVLNISWEIDLWGRLRAQKAGSVASLTATELDYEAARLSLAGQTAKSWFAALEADGQVGVAARTLESRHITMGRIRRRYNVGLADPLELRFAISDHALAESLLAERQRQAEAARRALQLLVHRYPSGELEEMTTRIPLPPLPEPVPAGLPAELVTRRPDLAAAEFRLAADGYSVTEARRALYPRLTLTGSAGRLSTEIIDLLDRNFSIWDLAGGLLAPIFQGGRLRAAVDLAQARQSESLALYVRQSLGAFSEVEGSLAADGYLERREIALGTAVREANKALELAQDQYAAGLVTYLAVLESQRQALNAESQYLSVRRQRLEVRIDLHLALGGGWTLGSGRVQQPPGPPGGLTPTSTEARKVSG